MDQARKILVQQQNPNMNIEGIQSCLMYIPLGKTVVVGWIHIVVGIEYTNEENINKVFHVIAFMAYIHKT